MSKFSICGESAKVSLAILTLGCVVFWLYSNGFDNELIFDDLGVFKPAGAANGLNDFGLYARSLSFISYSILQAWFGEGLYWQRVFNAVFHIATAMLVGLFAYRLLERTGLKREATLWAAVTGAAVWAVNPVAVYAVGYLIQRSTVMATFFSVAMMLVFIEVLRSDKLALRWMGLFACAFLYVLVILSKESGAPVIAVLLPLYVYWCRPPTQQIMRVGSILVVLTLAGAAWLIGRQGWELSSAPEGQIGHYLPQLVQKSPAAAENLYPLSFVNQLWLFFCYGFLWFIPFLGHLSIDMRVPFPVSLTQFPQVLGVPLFVSYVAAAGYALFRGDKAVRLLGFLLVLPAIFFVTELAYVRLQEPFVLYRSYVWSIAIAPLVALGMVAARLPAGAKIVGVLCVCAVLTGFSLDRVQSMRNDLSVWKDAVDKIQPVEASNANVGEWRAFLNYGIAEFERKNYREAYNALETARTLGAPDTSYRENQGAVLVAAGQASRAVVVLEPIMMQKGVGYKSHFNLAAAYKFSGQPEKALVAFDRGLLDLELPKPSKIEVLFDAGMTALGVKNWAAAEKYLAALLELNPEHVLATLAYANLHFEQGKASAALKILSEAAARAEAPEYYHAKAFIYYKQGDLGEATVYNKKSLELKPDNKAFLQMREELAKRSRR